MQYDYFTWKRVTEPLLTAIEQETSRKNMETITEGRTSRQKGTSC